MPQPTAGRPVAPAAPLPWRIEDLDLGAIDAARVLRRPIALPAPVQRPLVPALTRVSTLAFV
jgi:hypothetical protein